MKKNIILIFLLGFSFHCFSQKPSLQPVDLNQWPIFNNAAINASGDFVFYYVQYPVGWKNSLVVQSTTSNWKIEIQPDVYVNSVQFTANGSQVVFRKKDSVGIIYTGQQRVEYISGITDFKISAGHPAWLAYLSSKRLTLRNLETGAEKSFESIRDFLFDPSGRPFIFLNKELQDSGRSCLLSRCALNGYEMETVMEGDRVSNLVLDATGKGLAFSVNKDEKSRSEKVLWYYNVENKNKVVLVDNRSSSLDENFTVDRMTGFSADGKRLFLFIKEKDGPKAKVGAVKLDVWNYSDTRLQSQQLKEPPKKIFQAIVNVGDQRVVRLEYAHEIVMPSKPFLEEKGMRVLFQRKYAVDPFEDNWQKKNEQSVVLASYIDGSRKVIDSLTGKRYMFLSREGKYIVYYDGFKKNFFCYSFVDGITRNITKGIATRWATPYRDDKPDAKFYPRGIAGWIKGDSAVLLYDQYDIWQVDPTGQRPAINLTHGYGRSHNIIFNVGLAEYATDGIDLDQPLILNAFNISTKENGFYKGWIGASKIPELLSMGPYVYELPNNPYVGNNVNFPVIKAQQRNVYILRRMSENEFPNMFVTGDFKTFKPLSNLHPQRSYNWLTSELISWKALDGTMLQGILYKPENFTPQKKYPVIFNYYERRSQDLHVFIRPESYGDICIPLFVSNDYLVFVPDIRYTIGEPAKSAANAVLSAANMLEKLPFVDGKKMGIQGFSFGGIQTNFLVARTNRFAAACAASGVSDFVSGYNSLTTGGFSLQYMYETHQMRIGATLWERPDLYIENSAVFKADKVTTPLLMMNNKNDFICPFSNAVEFFTALRRLKKRVWMLQYDDCRHSLEGEAGIDFSIRMKQFFDHYLKNEPAPKWMTRGIPASLKGIDDGLEEDLNGSCGTGCKICEHNKIAVTPNKWR